MENVIRKIKDNNLTVDKADKGNILIIFPKNQLIDKTLTFLSDPNFQLLKSDPTSRFQTQIKTILKKSNIVLQKCNINQYINSNPHAPILRASIKIHKPGNPIRPIVNYIPAPAYRLKKFLNNLINQILIKSNKYNITNSKHLTDQLSQIHLTANSKMISLDIHNMYTNIPISETLTLIQNQLLQHQYNSTFVTQFVDLLRCTLNQNYFLYDSKFYHQKDGLPMGSSLSSNISEIFLQHLEQNNIEKLIKQHSIVFYGRYVDDILLIYNSNNDLNDNILNSFNSIHPNIQYSLEKEQNNKINFLDLKIEKCNNKIIFDIYRKPTTSKTSIHNQSICPTSYKFANFRYLLNRLNIIPLSTHRYNAELHNILSIAQHNNFPKSEILKLNKQIKRRIYIKSKTTLNDNKISKQWFPLPYYGNLSNNIKQVFNRNNINIAYTNHNYLRLQLQNRNIQKDKMTCSGIYKLKCQCGACYIGRTTRQFTQRYKEHKHDFKYSITNRSKYAAHCIQNCHPFENQQKAFDIIRSVNNVGQIDVWESLEIYRASQTSTLINEQHPNIENPLFQPLLKQINNQV